MFNSLIAVFRKNIRSYILIIALVVIWLGFGIAQPAFWSADHIQDIFTQMAIIAIMACGMVFVIVTGGIDLSVGFGSGFVSVVAAALLYFGTIEKPLHAIFPLLVGHGLEVITAIIVIILCMGVGLLIGLWQGFIIAFLALPPFIATLGGYYIFKSGILLVTQGKSLFISSNDTYKFIAQGLIPPFPSYVIAVIVTVFMFLLLFQARARKQKYGIELKSLVWELVRTAIFALILWAYVLIVSRVFDPSANPNVRGVPFLVIILAVIAILMSYVSMNTRFGRYAYAIGGNREAARLSGINIKKSIFRIYLTMGALVGVSGIALAAYVGSGTTAAGGGYELDVIASCILGGTSTLGGEGTVFGAIIGALIMQSLGNGMQMLNVNSNFQYMIKGFVLILAVWADISNKKKKS
ncbi:MAG: sugar ABC transporter permease [Rectinemataceae bacterium]|jgi:D-xylose transport system permease protein